MSSKLSILPGSNSILTAEICQVLMPLFTDFIVFKRVCATHYCNILRSSIRYFMGWSNSGVVVAYLGRQGVRGPCFRIGGNLSVKKIIAGDNHVHAADNANEVLGSWTKGGVNKWNFRSVFFNLFVSCKSLNQGHKTFFRAPYIFKHTVGFDSTGRLAHGFGTCVYQYNDGSRYPTSATSSLLTHLELSHTFLVSGSSDGYVRVHDPRTGIGRPGGADNLVKAHARSIQGLQTAGSYIFTIGMGERHVRVVDCISCLTISRQSRPFPDPLVKVYDVRTMKALPPIPFPAGPAFIHTMPMLSSSLAIISNEGLINIVDASDPLAANEFYQV
jgi:PAB-dependent poly(A)-specific ribonuclease subunit 2